MLYRMLIGWGVPLVIASLIFVDEANTIIRNDVEDAQFCFVNVQKDVGAVVFVPMGLCLTVNLVIFFRVGWKMFVLKKSESRMVRETSVI